MKIKQFFREYWLYITFQWDKLNKEQSLKKGDEK